jgi:hypothetical protein
VRRLSLDSPLEAAWFLDEVVFAEPSDMTLGVRTVEGFGVQADKIAHRFVATTTIVASHP